MVGVCATDLAGTPTLFDQRRANARRAAVSESETRSLSDTNTTLEVVHHAVVVGVRW